MTIEITSCEVCGSQDLIPVLDLGRQPLCGDLIPIGDPAECERFPIEILYCPVCRTAHQRYQVPKAKLFPESYQYRSRVTKDVLSGMDQLVESVESRLGPLSGKTVLDVGCNDGSLLDKFARAGAHTIGVEPTGAYREAFGWDRTLIHDFFSRDVALRIREEHPHIDVITFTNVFAHIENLPALLDALDVVMDDDTELVIENHHLGSILAQNQFDTFYHEHPRTYGLTSFQHVAERLGRQVTAVEFPRRYGGNIRVAISKKTWPSVDDLLQQETGFPVGFVALRAFIAQWVPRKRAAIKALAKANGGPLPAKAFPGRAAILISLLGLSTDDIEAVYEIRGSLKVGHYVPGTRIPIRPDVELFDRIASVDTILNLAWHIPYEVEANLRAAGYHGRIVQIV